MMTNLFSAFDPCTGLTSMNWLSILLMFFILPYKKWTMNNKQSVLFSMIVSNMHKEIKMLMSYKGSSIMFINIFIMILINNMMGLMPYIFTSSSHLVYSLTLALPMWLGFMLFGWLKNTNNMFIHMVPVGTPKPLMPFMVMIETISNLIRPGSLAVRLSANMIAGHLLMSLLGNNCSSMIMLTLVMSVFIVLMLFELAVAMIQAYVFMTLTTLYSSEI